VLAIGIPVTKCLFSLVNQHAAQGNLMNFSLRIFVFLIVAFASSWACWFIGIRYLAPGINDKTMLPFVNWLFFGIYGPAASAIVTTLIFDGLAGLKQLLARLFFWRASPFIYIFIVLLPIAATGLAIWFYALRLGPVGRFNFQAIGLVPVYLLSTIKFGPFGEELGWRGFLLPHLQQKFSPFNSSLMIGFIWFSWHIPLFFAPIGTAVSGAPITLLSAGCFYVFVTCLACIYTWLFNCTKGSVLITLLIHLSINAGLLMLFFPGLADHGKTIYYLSVPVYMLITVVLGIRTGFSRPGTKKGTAT
jgi:membrane protease YdiL (CAAX protease family)